MVGMLRSLIAALLLFATAAAAQDKSGISSRIAETGLAATATSLEAATSPGDRLALGGVLFLHAIEKTLQTRWRHGMVRSGGFVPVLRLPVPPNPAPDPFRAELVAEVFQTLIDDMTAARAPLETIGDADDAGVLLSLADIWFDIDMDGVRSADENLMRVAGATLRLGPRSGGTAPTIRFDTADAAWLGAYTHLLSAVADIVLAFDPTPQIARVIDTTAAMGALGASSGFANAYETTMGAEIDMAAMILFSLQQQPDPTRTRSARTHLLAMIAQNRVFWARVATETDNFAEWIPNASQVSALGLTVPPDTADVWLAVLTDAEDALEGRKLIPFWRLRKGAGINLKRLMQDPVPVDLAEWVHGAGLLPYMQDGERIGSENWWRLQELAHGDAALFAVWLN